MPSLFADDLSLERAVAAGAWVATFVIPALVHRTGSATPRWQKVAPPADRPVTLLMALANLSLPLWFLWPAAGFWSTPRPPTLLAPAVGTTALGLVLYWRAHRDLGPNWSITVAVHEQQALQTQGVYTYIRHPMYTALVLLGAGYAQLIPSLFPGLLPLLATLALVAVRLRHEERAMHAHFGEAWVAYVARTYRFIPWVW